MSFGHIAFKCSQLPPSGVVLKHMKSHVNVALLLAEFQQVRFIFFIVPSPPSPPPPTPQYTSKKDSIIAERHKRAQMYILRPLRLPTAKTEIGINDCDCVRSMGWLDERTDVGCWGWNPSDCPSVRSISEHDGTREGVCLIWLAWISWLGTVNRVFKIAEDIEGRERKCGPLWRKKEWYFGFRW